MSAWVMDQVTERGSGAFSPISLGPGEKVGATRSTDQWVTESPQAKRKRTAIEEKSTLF